MSGQVIVIAAMVGILWYGGHAIGHGVKRAAIHTGHGIKHVVTLGKK